jgi:exodeoxyribonuclease VII large subunit
VQKHILTLHQFNHLIQEVIEDGLPGSYLITAEIASMRIDQKGHCYLELVERDENTIIAQMRATIWSFNYRVVARQFRMVTGMRLTKGIKILLDAKITFHERYGLSLNVQDIDPSYTLGEMALKRRDILDRLKREGLFDLNKSLELPPVILRIAVISSPGAAGYGDFISHVNENPYGYRFSIRLFNAFMQGESAESSIISALEKCGEDQGLFDVAVLIRGGGGEADLHCFDSYEIGKEIARMPIPVISGIGHERDRTVVDEVSHTSVKTPTAAAELIVQRVREFHLRVLELESRLADAHRAVIGDRMSHLYRLSRDMEKMVTRFLAVEEGGMESFRKSLTRAGRIPVKGFEVMEVLKSRYLSRVEQIKKDQMKSADHFSSLLKALIRTYCNGQQLVLAEKGKSLLHLDPRNVLKRGYTITMRNGNLVNDAQNISLGDIIKTILYKGTITSSVREVSSHGEET